MVLLPCLRRGSDRWWLPCSGDATQALGQLILRGHHQQPLDEATRDYVRRTMESDPPLLIFAALASSADRLDTGQLVDSLAEHATTRFASGDAFLGAPRITQATEQRWRSLSDHFRTLPLESWIDDAAMWLEVTGPKVSRTWQQQWPRIVSATNGPTENAGPASTNMLQQLARMMQRQHSIESQFDDSLRRSKLASIKQLAYGLSHEINNPLANISTRAQQLQRGEDNAAKLATLQRIVDQVYRAHEMIADLMFYANPPDVLADPFDLLALLSSVAETFREETERQNIRLKCVVGDQEQTLNADQDMIGDAIRVLLRNAVEAVGSEGTIVVSLEHDDDAIEIHIADSGPGLSDEDREHAFDPYYSGREAGRGLGLGLCRAYRVARLHHGDVRLAGGPAGCVATLRLQRRGIG